jgi:hypothetical protein
MKQSTIILLIIGFLILGYILGNILPMELTNLSLKKEDQGIKGDILFILTAKMIETKTPIPNVEIDLGLQPGNPPAGGIAITDENGMAIFSVQAGTYFIYFNDNTFPKHLVMPEPEEVIITEKGINDKTIFFTVK